LGMATFSNLQPGSYTIAETLPVGYYGTTPTTKTSDLNLPVTLEFGNVCLGAGGARGMGYWMSKSGQQTLENRGSMEYTLMELRYLGLRNADGSDFDPWTYVQLREWMKNANASNMAYMLSAQTATLFLNMQVGFVNWNSILYTPNIGSLGEGNFSLVWETVMAANNNLYSNGYTPAHHTSRSYQEILKNTLNQANNNVNFVQAVPCSMQMAPVFRYTEKSILPESRKVVWPNPSSGIFNLRITDERNKEVEITITDIAGRRMLSLKGATNRDIRFGEKLLPGIYFVEIWCDGKKSIDRIIKQ